MEQPFSALPRHFVHHLSKVLPRGFACVGRVTCIPFNMLMAGGGKAMQKQRQATTAKFSHTHSNILLIMLHIYLATTLMRRQSICTHCRIKQNFSYVCSIKRLPLYVATTGRQKSFANRGGRTCLFSAKVHAALAFGSTRMLEPPLEQTLEPQLWNMEIGFN